ncbi:hypothetical protein EIN_372260 [Entamoeba invadens IP1]|uniref:Uncharacterized protein n=1 Tax=Entamoeba invadens IP1 TaxID=370355 RepID=A0A0A1UFN7_ENTIV|nr:hypothetical protein EIN_372260 [Entamoeba invadens IP1]ELP92804.1 hypothetical protein EIN_372260 [Entamoeba invadens IP1]|eukprot:XP_004259575.1 hypothetical protein EIN_372260 [Entamoeba invadens IP1]
MSTKSAVCKSPKPMAPVSFDVFMSEMVFKQKKMGLCKEEVQNEGEKNSSIQSPALGNTQESKRPNSVQCNTPVKENAKRVTVLPRSKSHDLQNEEILSYKSPKSEKMTAMQDMLAKQLTMSLNPPPLPPKSYQKDKKEREKDKKQQEKENERLKEQKEKLDKKKKSDEKKAKQEKEIASQSQLKERSLPNRGKSYFREIKSVQYDGLGQLQREMSLEGITERLSPTDHFLVTNTPKTTTDTPRSKSKSPTPKKGDKHKLERERELMEQIITLEETARRLRKLVSKQQRTITNLKKKLNKVD